MDLVAGITPVSLGSFAADHAPALFLLLQLPETLPGDFFAIDRVFIQIALWSRCTFTLAHLLAEASQIQPHCQAQTIKHPGSGIKPPG